MPWPRPGIFTEGYRATAGDHILRDDPAAEASRLGRMLPGDPEVGALLALMLLQHARRDARMRDGRWVLLGDQDRTRWKALEIAEGLAELLPTSHHLPTARAEMLLRLGDRDGAIDQFDRALTLVRTTPERDFLAERRASISPR